VRKETGMPKRGAVEDFIGKDLFLWISREFNANTKLKEIPGEIIDRISLIDITSRDYQSDLNCVTAIALITFAYKRAGRYPDIHAGPKDLLLMKVLAKQERSRRRSPDQAGLYPAEQSFCEIFTGEIGSRIRSMGTMNCAV